MLLCPRCHSPLADAAAGCPRCLGGAPVSAATAALRTAFEIEQTARAFYQRAAVDCADDTLRALFARFAVMEGAHMETLARRYHLDVPDPSPQWGVQTAAVFADLADPPRDPEQLFRAAIALEGRAAEFFSTKASQLAAGSPEQRLFQELAAEECEHAALLESEYASWRARRPAPIGNAVPAAAPRPLINAAALLLAPADASRIAIVCGDQQLSYGELRDRVARAAAVWHARGLRLGDRVAIKLPDGIDWVVAFLGTIWAGGVAVGVNPHIPAPEWAYILEEAGFNVIVAESADDTPAPWNARVIGVEEGRRAVAAASPIEPVLVADDTPALWVHSSGTSGRPKAVVHAHRMAREIERVSRERVGIGADDRLFATSRLFFSYPQTNSLFAGLKIGATVILDPQWPTAASAVATAARARASVFMSVPSLYRNLLHDGLALALVQAGVKRCVSAGEPLPARLRQAWQAATGLDIVDGYGASEVLVLVLTARGADDGLQPSPGVQVQALDAAAVAAGLPTRLRIRVSTQALGYLDRPAAQADSFRDGAFCPADLFVQTPGGGWSFAGREDSLVKIKGRWVNLVELEDRLGTDTPDLREAAAVCVPDAEGVDTVVLFYAASAGHQDAVERVLRERAAALPGYQRPGRLHRLDTLPRTPTGKLLRRRLAELLRSDN